MQVNSFAGLPVGTPRNSAPSAATQPMDCLTDQELLGLHSSGDLRAADVLIRRYDSSIHGLAYSLAKDYDNAQEIASQAFVRIYENLHTLKHAITLRAWINRIVVNIYINTIRTAKRHQVSSLDELQAKYGDWYLSAPENDRSSPELLAESGERRDILNNAIAALPEYHRKLVKLFHHEEYSYDEIAKALQIPIGTVKSRLNRARVALRAMLTPHMELLAN